MSYYLYSPEDFPSKRRSNKAYQNIPEWIYFGNQKVYGVEAHKWVKLERKYSEQQYADFTDKRGSRVVILDDEFAEAIMTNFTSPDSPNFERGVMILEENNYKSPKVRERVERECEDLNRRFRARVISEFEAQLAVYQASKEGRPHLTPYEEECYDVLGTPRPNSLEALMMQRQPGVNIGRQIVEEMRKDRIEQATRLGGTVMGASPDDISKASQVEVEIETSEEVVGKE